MEMRMKMSNEQIKIRIIRLKFSKNYSFLIYIFLGEKVTLLLCGTRNK